MNAVSIQFEPMQRCGKILIDGERVSPYGDLAFCEGKDLHVCGMRLLSLLDEELAREYRLEMRADPFLITLMGGLARQSRYCAQVTGRDVSGVFSIGEIADYMAGLAAKYSLDADTDFSLRVAGDGAGGITAAGVKRDEEAPDLLILKNMPAAPVRGRTALILSDRFFIRNEMGMNLVEVPEMYADAFCEYYRRQVKLLPFAEAVGAQCRGRELTREEKATLEAYAAQRPRYLFEMEQTAVEMGARVNVLFRVAPESAAGAFVLKVKDGAVLSLNDGEIMAVGEGTGAVMVLDREGRVCESREVRVVRHAYADSIRLLARDTALTVGGKTRIDAYILPEDAEDARAVAWTSSNPNVVYVTSAGEAVALKPGAAVITAAGKKAQASVSIVVKPVLEKIYLSKPGIALQSGQSEIISCIPYPADAELGEIRWTLSSGGLGGLTVSNKGQTCQFTACSSAAIKGMLTCSVKGTGINMSCDVEVTPEKRPGGLRACAIVFSIIGIVLGLIAIPSNYAAGRGLGAGLMWDLFLPAGVILSVIGIARYGKKYPAFRTMLILDVIFFLIALLFAYSCASCAGPRPV